MTRSEIASLLEGAWALDQKTLSAIIDRLEASHKAAWQAGYASAIPQATERKTAKPAMGWALIGDDNTIDAAYVYPDKENGENELERYRMWCVKTGKPLPEGYRVARVVISEVEPAP